MSGTEWNLRATHSSAHVLVPEQHHRALIILWHSGITKGIAGLQSRNGHWLTSMCNLFTSSFAGPCWGACYRKRSGVSCCCMLWVSMHARTHARTHAHQYQAVSWDCSAKSEIILANVYKNIFLLSRVICHKFIGQACTNKKKNSSILKGKLVRIGDFGRYHSISIFNCQQFKCSFTRQREDNNHTCFFVIPKAVSWARSSAVGLWRRNFLQLEENVWTPTYQLVSIFQWVLHFQLVSVQIRNNLTLYW